jgi:selenocysteine lyase/cysteine desulfurase
MTESKDETIEGAATEGQTTEDDRKLTLSEALEQIFVGARDAIVPGTDIEQRKRDLDSALAAFMVINSSPLGAPFDEIRDRLLAVQLTSTIREQIAKACPELSIGVADIQNYHEQTALRYADVVDESGFLRNMIEARTGETRLLLTEETSNELNRIEVAVSNSLGGRENSGLAHLLFYCLEGDLERVHAVIDAQIKSYRNVEQVQAHEASRNQEIAPPPPFFVRQLVEFLEEYGYISQFLIANSERPNGMEDRCRRALGTVLHHPTLTYVRRTSYDPVVNLDQILFELSASNGLKPDQFTNPWFQGDLKKTPFDAEKVRNILRMDMSYREKARILLAINQYALDEEEEAAPCAGSQKLIQIKKKDARSTLTLEDLRLRKTFLALLHPKCVVKNKEVQAEFMDIVKSLEGDRRLDADPELGQSISTLLHTSDPFLDVPIRQCRNKSIRELLMNLCFAYFDDDAIKDGITVRGETVRLFPLPDAEGLVTPQDVPLQRYFNTAFIGLERGFLSRVADAMVSIYSFDEIIRFAEKEAQHYFETTEAAERGYRFYFYESASHAFRDVVRKCFFTEHDYRQSDSNVIITNQEFGGITRMFEKNAGGQTSRQEELPDPGLKIVYLNNEDTRQPKTVSEFFQDINRQLDIEKTKIILISSQTRFGDTPCSSPHAPAGHQLAQLVQMLKRAFPNVAVAIDACQAIGRTLGDSLEELGADIYFTSGVKALGVTNANKGSVAMMALSNSFLEKLGPDRFSHSYYGTMPIANIAAQALAMRMLRSKIDLSRIEGNLGENRRLTLEQKIAKRMGVLTQSVIDHCDEYGQRFVAEQIPRIAPELTDKLDPEDLEDLEKWMGCRVHYPAHRNQQDYCGIVTFDLPSKSGDKLLKALQSRPYRFDLHTCLYRDRALRVSLHYLHEISDIDALFDAIRSAHGELLIADYQQEKPFRDKRNWTTR